MDRYAVDKRVVRQRNLPPRWHAAVGAVVYVQVGLEVSIDRLTVRLPSVDAVRGALPRRHVARKELIPNYNETRNAAVNTVKLYYFARLWRFCTQISRSNKR